MVTVVNVYIDQIKKVNRSDATPGQPTTKQKLQLQPQSKVIPSVHAISLQSCTHPTPITTSTPIQSSPFKKDTIVQNSTATKISKIVISANASATDIFKQNNSLLIGTNNIANLVPAVSTSVPNLTATAAAAPPTNQSYQLLFTTVAKSSHPRIKYSGLKKGDDKPIIVETVVPAINANATANILDISNIGPLMSTPLSSTITIPASIVPTQTIQASIPKNSQIINLNSADLSSAVKYADIDDIELPDGTKIGYTTDLTEIKRLQQQQQQVQHATDSSNDTSCAANLAEKYSVLAATALKNFDFSINTDSVLNQSNDNDNGSDSNLMNNDTTTPIVISYDDNQEDLFACRHCGKKYRWKSTLRRHENDECGNKEPSHQCPYCPYKAKQRGNLGVHVRKHHTNLPQLESRRKKKK